MVNAICPHCGNVTVEIDATMYSYMKEVIEMCIEEYGLGNWRVHIEQSELDDHVVATTYYDADQRSSRIVINTKLCFSPSFEITTAYLAEYAEHEVLHLVMAEMASINDKLDMSADNREDMFGKAEHAAINTIIRRLKRRADYPLYPNGGIGNDWYHPDLYPKE